jgi:hypothetical protein
MILLLSTPHALRVSMTIHVVSNQIPILLWATALKFQKSLRPNFLYSCEIFPHLWDVWENSCDPQLEMIGFNESVTVRFHGRRWFELKKRTCSYCSILPNGRKNSLIGLSGPKLRYKKAIEQWGAELIKYQQQNLGLGFAI